MRQDSLTSLMIMRTETDVRGLSFENVTVCNMILIIENITNHILRMTK